MPLYDLECQACGAVHEEVRPWNEDGKYLATCAADCLLPGVPGVESETMHRRIPSRPARYMGEVRRSPMISGGKADTMGRKRCPVEMPEPPDDVTGGGLRDFFDAQPWREYEKAKASTDKENAAKRERARLIRSGANIDIRHHPLPGDPKL